MKLVMTLLLRDEEDIVRENLDFHLAQGVDRVIVTDNGSEDATVEILREYEARGVVRLLLEPADDYSQGRWVTRMARLAAAEGADWVINNDADEFWWPRSGTLASTFEGLGDEVGDRGRPSHQLRPRPEDGRRFWERMTARERESLNPLGKPLPPKVAHRAHREITVVQGNHRVEGPDLGGARRRRLDRDPPLPDAHLRPVREQDRQGRSRVRAQSRAPAPHRPHLATPV